MKKSLLDIQKDIRELDAKIKEVNTAVAGLYKAIDDLNSDEANDNDFAKIRVMAAHFTFGRHPLSKLSNAYACYVYLKVLLSLAQLDKDHQNTMERLVFIHWLLSQAKLEVTLEELYKDSLQIETEFFYELPEIIPQPYYHQLVLDALITANICGQGNKNILLYVVNLCSIFGIEKEQLRIFSVIAAGVLKQDFIKIKKTDLKVILTYRNIFEHYLGENVPENILILFRKIVVKAPDETYRGFKWRVKQQSCVKKGDVIASYRADSWYGPVTTIKAPAEGMLFQFRNNYINYGVIANENDNKDSIKAWVKKGTGK